MVIRKEILLCLLISLFVSVLEAQSPPNVVLILVDDQGWSGTSVSMDTAVAQSISDYYQTPQLEQFALQGQTFSRAYAPAPKCTPTRASILSGQTTARNRVTNTTVNNTSDSLLIDVASSTQIDTNWTTLPEVLHTLGLGYQTAHYGKWHLGSTGPEGNGFDRSDGSTTNTDGDQGATLQSDPKKIFSITDSAMQFMSDAVGAGAPFYVQLSHYAVHSPIEVQPSTLNAWSNTTNFPPGTVHTDSVYAGMTADLDSSLGLILTHLTQLGIESNTYVIWYSDNGAARNESNNRPLSRGKPFLDEGGIRVPLLVRGPGIPAGSRNNLPVIGYDLYPTIIDWASGSVTAVPGNVEGLSLATVLAAGGQGSLNRSTPLIFHSPHYEGSGAKDPRSAIIKNQYKLMVNYETGEFLLHDMVNDVQENDNLKDSLPAIFNDLCLELRDYLKSTSADMPMLNPAFPGSAGAAPDVDQDGLDDEWEFRELLTVAYDSTADPDADGLSNGWEQSLGTDPYVFDSIVLHTDPGPLLDRILAYPNPAWDQVQIDGLNSGETTALYNLQGQLVIPWSSTSNSRLSLNQIPSGRYFLVVRRGTQLVHSQTLQVE